MQKNIDIEKVYEDGFYKSNNVNGSIKDNDDALFPNIRINFFSNVDKDIWVEHQSTFHKARYKLDIPYNQGKGVYLVKTIYYKNLSRKDFLEIKRLYSIKYANIKSTSYIDEVLAHLEENFKYNMNFREVTFIPIDSIIKEGSIEVDGFKFAVEPDKLLNSAILDNDDCIFRFVLVSDIYTEDRRVNLGEDATIRVISKSSTDKNIEEGLYIEDLLTNELKRVDTLLMSGIDNINSKIIVLEDKIKKGVSDEISAMIELKNKIRNLIYTKYKNVYDLILQDNKLTHELNMISLKTDLEKEKGKNIILAHEQKQEQHAYDGITNFVKDILKVVGI